MDKLNKPITGVFDDARKREQDISSPEDACDVRLERHASIRSPRPRNARIIQNFLLIWLDSSIDEVNNDDCRNIIPQLQQVVNSVNIFTDVDECVNFLTGVGEEKTFLILSETFVETTVPIIHELPQVNSIWVFPGDKTQHEEWLKQWPKIKDVFADITSMCEELKNVTQECDRNSISVSFVSSDYGKTNQNLDQLDPSFMYTQILKEILLTIDFEQQHINQFIMYCRQQFVGNITQLQNFDKLEKEYRHHTPIWWYTGNSLIYSMLNRALRLMDVDIIIKIGFLIGDLHRHIAQLHSEQYSGCKPSLSFTVYRGQALSRTDFEQLIQMQGGLISFNNFLSTSYDRHVSLLFAESHQHDPDLVGVLFEITVDPSISSTPFANISSVSNYQAEQELLFSMHSLFRIGQITQIDKSNRLWQVDLTLTTDTDPQLYALTEYMRKESFPHQKNWYRLGSLMIRLAQFNKAQQVFEIMLEQAGDENEKANIYHMLGIVKFNNGEYAEAITFYEKSIEIMEKILPSTHPDLAASYRNMGTVYGKMGEYSKALSYHGKALQTYQTTTSSNHFTYSASDDDSNLMNKTTDDCLKAIQSFEKAFKVLQQTLPADDLSLATFYDRYGSVYEKMGDHSKALSFYDRALKIKEKHLPSNHPSLAASYASHGDVYENMGDPATAHSFHQRAFDIGQRVLPANHPDLQVYRQKVEN